MKSNDDAMQFDQGIDTDSAMREFYIKYTELSDMVRRFPIPSQLQSIILKEFDTGFLWTKEAFNILIKSKAQSSN